MEKLKIMLCCGAGMSSGFLAQKTRQAAKKKGVSVTVEARSESAINQYIDDIDILLIGPHCASSYDMLKEIGDTKNVIVSMIPPKIYSSLDGEQLLNLALNLMNNGE